MSIYFTIRNHFRKRNLRQARSRRAEDALRLREMSEAKIAEFRADFFSEFTRLRIESLHHNFDILASKCADVARINNTNARAPYRPLDISYRKLVRYHEQLVAKDQKWSKTAQVLRNEFRLLMIEGKQYQLSVQDRLRYHERSFEACLERASRLLLPEEDCTKASDKLEEARKELVIPRSAVQRTRVLPTLVSEIVEIGVEIGPVRKATLDLTRLSEVAVHHCQHGDYVMAESEAQAAEQLATSIRQIIETVVKDARASQRQWKRLASDYPEFNLRFGSSITRVQAISEPKDMLREWTKVRYEMGAFALKSACRMGNFEQNYMSSEIGEDARVNWQPKLDREELSRFARVCGQTDARNTD